MARCVTETVKIRDDALQDYYAARFVFLQGRLSCGLCRTDVTMYDVT